MEITNRWLIVPQQYVGEDTSKIERIAPKTWEYLNRYKEVLENRGSSIYNKKPSFSIFGVGPYTFTNWKIGVSGFHKQLNFSVIRPIHNRPVVLDDTSYFLPASSKEEAILFYALLKHPIVTKFLNTIIYWNAKRPISQKILQQLHLSKITRRANLEYVSEAAMGLHIPYDEKKLESQYLDHETTEA